MIKRLIAATAALLALSATAAEATTWGTTTTNGTIRSYNKTASGGYNIYLDPGTTTDGGWTYVSVSARLFSCDRWGVVSGSPISANAMLRIDGTRVAVIWTPGSNPNGYPGAINCKSGL